MNEFLQNLRSNKDRRYSRNRKSYDNQYSGGNTYSQGGQYQDRRKQRYSQGGSGAGYAQDQQMHKEESAVDINLIAEGVLSTLKNIAKAQERRAEAENRKAEALEGISAYLMKLAGVDLSQHIEKVKHEKEQMFEDRRVIPEPVKADTKEELPAEEPVQKVSVKAEKKAEAPVKKTPARKKIKKQEPAKAVKKAKPAKKKSTGSVDIASERVVVMKIIKEMRKEGATYNMIAQRLIDDNIPTFSRKGQWHAQTIHRLCQSKKK